MSQLSVPEYDSRKFHWERKGNIATATCEASDLGPNRAFVGLLYDDACDEGFAIRSHVTGAVIRFALLQAVRDREGDVQFWVLEPTSESYPLMGRARCDARPTPITVMVFND